MYEMKAIVGTSQIDKNGFLKPSSIFDLMQDCSFFQLDSEIELTKYFNENNVSMFLVSRQVDIYKLPKYSDKIIVRTYVYECNEAYGYRNTVIYDENYNELVICYAIGGFVDLSNGNLIRVPSEFIKNITFDEKQEMNYLPRKIKIDNDLLKEINRFKVKKYFIDDNNHVNNARYIDMAIDYVDNDDYKRVRIEYRIPAELGDTIIVKRAIIDDKVLLKFDSDDDKTYAILEFSYSL
ncbi:acyl-ACP thioesterase domain-containing protein [Brachyspira sp.]|uniref:acyl-[acyl-carrier-protein] thioesterase n=1 Tax=Brachyspira sp. TaxID=1977261 RepID=UPI00260D6224|nr:acyl-ACP thioesterase domain-containing protein [Brachyspira sp.]